MQPTIYIEENSNLEYLKIDNGAKKLICLLHGYGASMYDLYSLSQVIPTKEYNWMFLNAPLKLNMGGMEGRAWFPIDMQALEIAMREGGHRAFADIYPQELEESRQMCLKFFDAILPVYDELHLGGFSQGAMLSSHILRANISKLKTLTLFSGNLIGREELASDLDKLSPLSFFQGHGHHDPVLAYEQAKDLFELLKLGGHRGEFFSFQGGHEIPMNLLEKWKSFLSKN